MNTQRKILPRRARLLAVLLAALAPAAALAGEMSMSDVFWAWDPGAVTGTSQLVRTDTGLSATVHATDIPPGSAVTLWIIVFNKPWLCQTRPCGDPDLFNPAVEGDFLLAGGHVVGASGEANFAGYRMVGDNSGSGFLEFPGDEWRAVGLTNPHGAEVQLVLHSHGPAASGQVLKSQIGSYLGGCTVFLGTEGGVATKPEDVPLMPGECSSVQFSVHAAD